MTDSRAAMSEYPRCVTCEHWYDRKLEYDSRHEESRGECTHGRVHTFAWDDLVYTPADFGCLHHSELTDKD